MSPDELLSRARVVQAHLDRLPLARRTALLRAAEAAPSNGGAPSTEPELDDDYWLGEFADEEPTPSSRPATPHPITPVSVKGDDAATLDNLAPTLGTWLSNPDLLKPPPLLISHLAWRGRLTLYSALDKSGKSTFVSAAVAAASRGDPFLGEGGGAPVRIIWACLEEHAAELVQRLQRFGADADNVRVIAYPRNVRADIERVVELWKPDVLVIDTLIRYARGRVTKSGESAQWAAVMQDFLDYARGSSDTAVVLLHHAARRSGEARDSGDIPANCDAVLEQRKRHSAGKQRFTVRARFALRNFAVRLVGTTYELLEQSDAADTLDASLRPCLEALAGRVLTASAWLHASGENEPTFYRHLRELRDGGHVEQDGKSYTLSDAGRKALGPDPAAITINQLSPNYHDSKPQNDPIYYHTITPHGVGVSDSKRVRGKTKAARSAKKRTRR